MCLKQKLNTSRHFRTQNQGWRVSSPHKYRAYTKEWCGFNVYYMNTAPFFCVCPVHRASALLLVLIVQNFMAYT